MKLHNATPVWRSAMPLQYATPVCLSCIPLLYAAPENHSCMPLVYMLLHHDTPLYATPVCCMLLLYATPARHSAMPFFCVTPVCQSSILLQYSSPVCHYCMPLLYVTMQFVDAFIADSRGPFMTFFNDSVTNASFHQHGHHGFVSLALPWM